LVKWGLEKQKETGLNCYLQASEQGRNLYSNYKFQDIDTVVFNLERFGLIGVERMTEMIRYPTESGTPETRARHVVEGCQDQNARRGKAVPHH
jgi:hypothetical protein